MMDKYYFYQSYYYSLKGLKRETRYAIREAIDDFMFEDKEPNFKDALSNSIWMLLIPTLRKSKTKYENAKGKREADAGASVRRHSPRRVSSSWDGSR